ISRPTTAASTLTSSAWRRCVGRAAGAGRTTSKAMPAAASRAPSGRAPIATDAQNHGRRPMLSVVIATQDSERVLVPTLAALVPGAVAGVVREVIVADAGSHDDTATIADGAGCRLLVSNGGRGARLKAAAATARAPWLLFLRPGVVPEATWVD